MPSKKAIDAKAAKQKEILTLIFSSEAYSPEGTNSIFRRRYQGISDVEWKKVKSYSNLPNEARFEINRLIAFYWEWRVGEWIPTNIQTKVKHVRKQALALMDELKALSCDDNFYKGVFLEYKRSPAAYERELSAARDHLSKLESVLLDAEFRLVDGVSRASYKVAYTAMRALDSLCHGFGKQISASKKIPCGINFVLEVFSLIDVQIAPGSVTHVLKEYLRQRSDWGGIQKMALQFRG